MDESHAKIADSAWKSLYKVGGVAALAEIAIIVIQAPIFILYPQPTTVMSHFTQLLRECWRLLRPGELLHLTDVEIGVSNAPAHEDFWSLFLQAMRRTGRSFSPNDRHLGILCELEPLVFQAGFHTRCIAHVINYSSGTSLHEEWKRDLLMFARGVQSFLIGTEVSTLDHLNKLYEQQQKEMNMLSFHAILPMLTVWGRK